MPFAAETNAQGTPTSKSSKNSSSVGTGSKATINNGNNYDNNHNQGFKQSNSNGNRNDSSYSASLSGNIGMSGGGKQHTSIIKKIASTLDSGNLSTTDASKHMRSTTGAYSGNGSAAAAGQERQIDVTKIDDECFVCGHGGHLLLCDFPHCIRAYHQVFLF